MLYVKKGEEKWTACTTRYFFIFIFLFLMHKNDSKLSLCDICTLSICESLFWVTDPENHDTVEITYSFLLMKKYFQDFCDTVLLTAKSSTAKRANVGREVAESSDAFWKGIWRYLNVFRELWRDQCVAFFDIVLCHRGEE